MLGNTSKLPYDKKFLIRCFVIMAFSIIALKASGGAAFAVMIPMVAWSIMRYKSEYLFLFLLMTVAFMTGNGKLIPKNGLFWLCERGMMLGLALFMMFQIFGKKNSRYVVPFAGLLLYVAYMILPSMNGWSPLISGLKIYMFSSVFLAYYGTCNRVIMDERYNIKKVRSVMLAYASFLLLGSVLLIPFPGLSQMNMAELSEADIVEALASGGTSLFMGISSHSQLLGPLTAIVGVMVLGDYLFSVRKFNWFYTILNLCPLILIVKTSSRTAMVSYLFGCFVLLICFMRARGIHRVWKFKVVNLASVAVIFAILSVIAIPQARAKVVKFAVKYGGDNVNASQVNLDDITSTRQGKWDECIYNWRQSPMIGNGFQVAPSMASIKVTDTSKLLSAPVEKSIWISAVLEEGGVFGLMIFVGWIISACAALWGRHAYIGMACLLTMLVINLGEFSIFSMGYTGGILWASTFAAVVMDAQRYKHEKFEKMANADYLTMLSEIDPEEGGMDAWVNGK